MNKKFYLTGLAALALVGCSTNDDFSSSSENQELGNGEISFVSQKGVTSRGTSVGADAAAKLNNHFVVYGTKHVNAEDKTANNDVCVFDQYGVEYADNTAGTTESNTHNWEYVGKDNYRLSSVNQTIHYWDYSAAEGYTFYAFSADPADISYPRKTTDKVYVNKVSSSAGTLYYKGYNITVRSGASLDKLYFSDRTPVAKTAYGNPVTLAFRNMASKVRVGFYETIPGYSVKIDKFYFDSDASAAVTSFSDMSDADETNFKAAFQNYNTASENKFYVRYYDSGDVLNRAKIANNGSTYTYNLQLGSGIQSASSLGTTSDGCTWDKSGDFTTVFPFEDNTSAMLVKCDYTLAPEDKGKDVIKVTGARAIVPADYCKWKCNTAYTYIFKISDKTNGYTGSTDDPEGLYPITFDAYVVATENADMTEQQTITSVSSDAVTTYQQGKVVTANNEYIPGDIYCVNTKDDGTVITPSKIASSTAMAATEAVICKVTTTKDAISEATVLAHLNGAPNGISLNPVTSSIVSSIPAEDGTSYSMNAVKFTASEPVYAYIYCIEPYEAATYEAAGTYAEGTTYYMKTTDGVYYAASGITEENYSTYKSQLYTQKTAGTVGKYDIKVIKVVSGNIPTGTDRGDGSRAKRNF